VDRSSRPPADARALERRRLAAAEFAALRYGKAALLGPTPAGPATCPPSCPWCVSRWPTDWWGRAA
jgi:hypothetical protein